MAGRASSTPVTTPESVRNRLAGVDDAYIAPTSRTILAMCGRAHLTASGRLPMDSANWYEAYAFCIWDGGFLPSEAEWEYAAAGGDRTADLPVGFDRPRVSTNQYAIYGTYYGDAGNLAPVGSATLGAGLWGQLDMAGNALEWNLDWAYGRHTYFSPCVDCAYLTMPTGQTRDRVAKGGEFDNGENEIFTGFQFGRAPAEGAGGGFRCARAP